MYLLVLGHRLLVPLRLRVVLQRVQQDVRSVVSLQDQFGVMVRSTQKLNTELNKETYFNFRISQIDLDNFSIFPRGVAQEVAFEGICNSLS